MRKSRLDSVEDDLLREGSENAGWRSKWPGLTSGSVRLRAEKELFRKILFRRWPSDLVASFLRRVAEYL